MRGKSIGLADWSVVPGCLALASPWTAWRPRRPCSSRRLNGAREAPARMESHASKPACCRDMGTTSALSEFGGPTPLQKARLLRSLGEGLVAILKVAPSELPAEKCRGEAHSFASLAARSSLRLPNRPKGAVVSYFAGQLTALGDRLTARLRSSPAGTWRMTIVPATSFSLDPEFLDERPPFLDLGLL
jgi:hypothetical protein